MLNFSCPKCFKQYSANVLAAGKRTKCPMCGHAFRIPQVNISSDFTSENINDINFEVTANDSSFEKHTPHNFNQMDNELTTKSINNGLILTLIVKLFGLEINKDKGFDYKLILSNLSKKNLKHIRIWPTIIVLIGCFGIANSFRANDRKITVAKDIIITRGWLRAALEKKPETEIVTNYVEVKVTDPEIIKKLQNEEMIFGIIFIIIGFCWAIRNINIYSKREEVQKIFDSSGWMPATKLNNDFKENKFLAKGKYNNYKLNIYGAISKINETSIQLESFLLCKPPLFCFKKNIFELLKNGNIVYVKGICKEQFNQIYLTSCTFEIE